jgi:ribosome-associated toxin RatA of RatAB toxin-antitoxin module
VPIIESDIVINAPLDEVYALAKDVERFPDIMPDVESVTVLFRDGNRTVTEWVGVIRQFARKVKWTEEDEWDDANHRCVFRMTQGDFSKYEGTWDFVAQGDATKMVLVLDYEFDVPLIGPIIKGVVHKLVRANCDSMVTALKKAAEGGARSG